MGKRNPSMTEIVAIHDALHDTGDLCVYDLCPVSEGARLMYWRNLHGLADGPTAENRFASIERAISHVEKLGFTVFIGRKSAERGWLCI